MAQSRVKKSAQKFPAARPRSDMISFPGKLQGTERRSQRLQKVRQKEAKHFLPSPPTTDPLRVELSSRCDGRLHPWANESKASHRSSPPELKAVAPSCSPAEPETNQKPKRKRKRLQEVEAFQETPQKRLRPDIKGSRPPTDININGNPPLVDVNGSQSNPQLQIWLQGGSYPAEYFQSDNRTWEDIKADRMAQPHLGRKKSAASLVSIRRQLAAANMVVPTETIEDKSLPYRSPGYRKDLERCGGSYMFESPEGISDESKLVCQNLFAKAQAIPQDTLFRNELFSEACRKIIDRNEARMVEDISPLIAPSAETLATYGDMRLKHLIFNINERWGESISITTMKPQPDRCVGFDSSAFTWPRQQRLKQCIGHFTPIEYVSTFLATWKMYFPFFACEAKSGIGDLDVADKQNAHSMTMAVRGIVDLFKLVNREDELHRKILAFSISHDASIVRIYGHYALIENRTATYYRHSIREFSFTSENGKDKWTAYQFTKNVYLEFMPILHKMICSAIDQISLEQASQSSHPPPQVPLNAAFLTDTGLESEQPDSQDLALGAPGAQNIAGSKKRKVTKAVLEQENENYRGQNHQLLGQIDLLKQQHHSNADSGNDPEVVTVLQQHLDRLQQQLDRKDEELERQRLEMKEEHKREMDELRDLLRQSLSAQPKQKGKE